MEDKTQDADEGEYKIQAQEKLKLFTNLFDDELDRRNVALILNKWKEPLNTSQHEDTHNVLFSSSACLR